MQFPNFDRELEAQLGTQAEAYEPELEADSEEEGQEMLLAAELLGLSNQEELEQFLGGLISNAAGLASGLLKSPAGRQLGGLLQSAAKKALPQLGQAIGGHFGGESGAQLGARAAAKAGSLLGLELEGLTSEDREFEMARQFVRFAQDASQRWASSGRTPADARDAYVRAAREHAPGLVPGAPGFAPGGFPVSGRWVRRGRTITLM